jgi:hypothetical protein
MKKIKFAFGKKNYTTFIIASLVLVYAMYSSIDGLVYYFSDNEPIVLGDAMDVDKEAFSKVSDGDFVEVKGITSLQGGSLEKGFLGKRHFLYYFNGSSKFIVIEESKEDERKGPSRKTVRGRAHLFKTSSQAQKMREFFLNSLFLEMDDDGIFIESGLEPGKDHTVPVFFLILAALMILNIVLFKKYLKKDESAEEDFDDY